MAESAAMSCLTVLAETGQDPELVGLELLVRSGRSAKADLYIAQVARNRSKYRLAEMRAVTAVSSNLEGSASARAEGRSASSRAPSGPQLGGSDGGTTDKWHWKLGKEIGVYNCRVQGCPRIDTIDVSYDTNIFWDDEVILNGKLKARSGTYFRISKHTCKVYKNVAFATDPLKATFSACGTLSYTNSYTVYDQHARGMQRDSFSYLRVELNLADPNGGTVFGSFVWESQDWYTNAAGDQWYY